MGEYGVFIVAAYGVTLLVVIGNLVAARYQFRRTKQRLRLQLERRTPRRQGAGGQRADDEAIVGRTP